jgi:molybdopterin/thiamine biosynthesis adenylyltransferase
MDNQYRAIFSRNNGIFTEAEQDMLRKSAIAIAGVGGVGGLAAERLIRLGVGRLKITDPGDYEESNLNRQFASSMLNIGKKKIEAVFTQIKDINPQAHIFHSNTGINDEKDANLFADDCDFIIDAMDHGMFKQSILLQRAARHRGIHYLFTSAIGFGALAVVFDPKGLTLEEYNNLPLNVDIDNPEKLKVPLEKIVPILPSYATDITMLKEIIAGERPVPTNSIGAGLAAILAASEAINVILEKDVPKAPNYTYLDLVDRRLVAGTIS